MKEFLGEITENLFSMGLDEFKKIIIKLMKDNDKIPLEIKDFIDSTRIDLNINNNNT